jgi:hypothetical protein
MLLERSNPTSYWSEIVAAADPEPLRAPRCLAWPSVCDTTRTNWLNPSAESGPSEALPGAESFSIYVGGQLDAERNAIQSPPLLVCAHFSADHCYSRVAAPPPLSPDLRDGLYTTVLCGPGLPPPPASKRRTPPHPQKPSKKRGRPRIFDEIKRAEFLAMVKSGSTIRHAARRVGIDPGSVRNACQSDPLFADRVARAEQERDTFFIRRIQNAGEKSWRAAAWILERAEPNDFSLRQKGTALTSVRGQRRLQAVITATLQKLLPRAAADKPSTPDPQQKSIQDRLAAVESKLREYDSWGTEVDEPEDQPGERGGVSPPITNNGERGGVSPSMSNSDVTDPSDEAAADDAYHELLRLLGTDAAGLLQKNSPSGKK